MNVFVLLDKKRVEETFYLLDLEQSDSFFWV